MAGDGSTEALYLFELREVVLHGEHHLVELGRGAAIGQRSADIKRGALRIAIEVAIALAQEEADAAAKGLVERTAERVFHHRVRQLAEREAEGQDHEDDGGPAPFLHKGDVTAIPAVPADGATATLRPTAMAGSSDSSSGKRTSNVPSSMITQTVPEACSHGLTFRLATTPANGARSTAPRRFISAVRTDSSAAA